MKKLLFCILAITMIACLVGCGEKEVVEDAAKQIDNLAVSTFNSQFLQYCGEKVPASNVKALISKVGANNASGSNNIELNGISSVSEVESTNTYNVTASYGEDGKINQINITANSVPKDEQIGTAGSNMPLKDRANDAEYEIKVALQYLFEEIYGDKVVDARINVKRILTAEDEQENEVLKDMNLGMDEIAFEVNYDLKPASEDDVINLTVPNGEYDEESGWIKDVSRVGILRPNDDGSEQKYKVTNFGTGW